MASRLATGLGGAIRYRRTRALCQPRNLAGGSAAPGTGRLGISRTRGGRALVRSARCEESAMTMLTRRFAALLVPLLGAALRGTPLSAQASAGHLPPPAAPAVVIRRVAEPPRLDAFLAQSAAVEGAPITDFQQREPGDGIPVSQRTTAYLSYDDANLYVVFVCRDDPAKVRARIARREEIGADDEVVLYLDTFRDRERAYFFMTNPLGVQMDGILTEGQDEDLSWDAVWQSDGRLTPDGYVVRMTIPFRSLRFPSAPAQTWGVAL